jgi:hypothetical protein
MKDLHNVVRTAEALAPAALTTVAGRAGKIIDLAGYGGVEFVINYGSVTATNATITPVLKEGDVTGTLTSVADTDLLGTELLASLPAQATSRTSGVGKNVTTRLGYRGAKRDVQLSIASSTVTAATILSATALLHTPAIAPTTNP